MIKLLISFFLILLLSTGNCYFEEIGIAPRAAGLGNSFVAISDDMHVLYYNPAGLGKLNTNNIGFAYVQYYPRLGGETLSYRFLGVNLLPKKLGVIAIAWQNQTLEGILREDIFYISTARYLKKPKLYLGITTKILKLEYIYENIRQNRYFVEHGTSKTGFTIDIGLLKEISRRIQIGMSVKNLFQPDMGLGTPDIIPTIIRTGLSYTAHLWLIASGITISARDIIEFSAGIERTLSEIIKLRSGIVYLLQGPVDLSLGLSLFVKKIIIEYAWTFNILGGLRDTGGIHRYSLTIKF